MSIHKFQYNDKYIVLDINSSNVFEVDKLVFNVLDYYPECNTGETIENLRGIFSEKDIQSAIEELDELIISGKLFAKEQKVDMSAFHPGSVKALCLNISHDCNFACRYCFAADNTRQKKQMSFETAKKAIDFLVEKSKGRRNLEVDFFGGEPLMNFDVVKETVNYAKSIQEENNKNFRFTITTNGLLLDDKKMEFINENMRNIVFSLDGRAQVHNYMRPLVNGGESYELIIDKIKKAAASRGTKDYFVRGTFTSHNLDFSNDVEHMAKCGFKNISIEPVVCDPAEDYALRNEDIPVIFKQYDHIVDLYFKYKNTDNAFNFFHFNVDLDNESCIYKKMSGCGAGCEYLCVEPNGDIYPCHQFVGNTAFIIGNINEGITRDDIKLSFVNSSMSAKEECKDCWARYFCGGGCFANAYYRGGAISSVYDFGCKLHRKRMECALYIKCVQKD